MIRRDFINGVLVTAAASAVGCNKKQNTVENLIESDYYPPAKTGLRGSHQGSYEAAHQRAWGGRTDWGVINETNEDYDLVVVGGGISGLSAAHFYRKKYGEDKKILILENHDDFGGHAKRNEHHSEGGMRIGYGGAQTLESPSSYGSSTKELLSDLGVKINRFKKAYDSKFYKNNNLEYVTYFNKSKFGEDKVIPFKIGNYAYINEGIPAIKMNIDGAIKEVPLDDEGKKQLLNLVKGNSRSLKSMSTKMREKVLKETSYFEVLKKYFAITHPLIFAIVRGIPNDLSYSGTDVMTAWEAIWAGAPGFPDINTELHKDPYIHHFPDGNASIARLLVRKMIPSVAPGNTMDDIVLAKFNYDRLDQEKNNVRIRLNSMVLEAKHIGGRRTSKLVSVMYINQGQCQAVKAKHVVMACWNMVIPHIVPDLPKKQYAALRQSIKSPLVYTTVGLKNWRALKKKGIAMANCPGNWHQIVMMDYPVSMGGYNYTKNEDEPAIIQMIHIPYSQEYGVPPREQFKECRRRLLALSFEDFEEEVKGHLSGMFCDAGFDPERDISSITVNRWSHGYAYGGSRLFDSNMSKLAKVGRKRFGRITIANSDAEVNAYITAAIGQAKRAIDEIKLS